MSKDSEEVYLSTIGSLLWGCPATDSARVQIHPDFLEAHPVNRLDVIGDWIAVLTELRDETREECYGMSRSEGEEP